jgi:dTMP kinase
LKSLFIVFEGLDKSGKSTIMNVFGKKLAEKHPQFNLYMLRDPGGTEFSEEIRKLILHSNYSICDYSELFLYLAARASLTEKIKSLMLKENNIVILDRYYFSTYLYQNVINDIPYKYLKEISKPINIEPDLVIYVKRKNNDKIDKPTDRFEEKIKNKNVTDIGFRYEIIIKSEAKNHIIIENRENEIDNTVKILLEQFSYYFEL